MSAPRAGLRPARPPWGSRKLGAARRFLESAGLVIRRTEPRDAEALARMMGDPSVSPGLMRALYPSVLAWQDRRTKPPEDGSLDLLPIAERGGQAVGSAGLHPNPPRLPA